MSIPANTGQNPDELFDVVDESDRVIGQCPRREVHARKLRHRAVHVMVFNSQGRIFLQKRSLLKDSAPGTWSASCSGHLDAGEDYDAAAIRELREEIGLSPSASPQRWLRLRACEETGWEFVWIYRVESEGPFVLAPSEIDGGDWFTPAEIAKGMLENPSAYAESFLYFWPRIAMELAEG
ncbi:MAG: NUDIX domain-containing protein [Opitutaceae bacterium]|jgi:isopentenyl-diphosphate delta-isomerase type 1